MERSGLLKREEKVVLYQVQAGTGGRLLSFIRVEQSSYPQTATGPERTVDPRLAVRPFAAEELHRHETRKWVPYSPVTVKWKRKWKRTITDAC